MIFLDNASTTQVSEHCAEIAKKYMTEIFFNPSAPYHPSVQANEALNRCRSNILKMLKGNGKLIFTSSGTESDNLALFGSKKVNNSRIIVSQSEHPAIKKSAEELFQRGFDVVFAEVDSSGRVIQDKFADLITENTSLISIMHVNNETGAINDIKKLCEIAKRKNPSVIFHSDGVQAVGKINVHLDDIGVDLYSFSGHKIHAPRGVGALYIKKGVNIRPIIFGGGQEFNIRSSTENLACIAALEYALKNAIENLNSNYQKINDLNMYLRKALEEKSDNFYIISKGNCSPYILNFAMKYVRGEVMLHSLEKYQIYIGTGSACSSKKSEKNTPIILGLPEEYKKGILRISLAENTSLEEINTFINKINLEYNMLKKYMRG